MLHHLVFQIKFKTNLLNLRKKIWYFIEISINYKLNLRKSTQCTYNDIYLSNFVLVFLMSVLTFWVGFNLVQSLSHV